MQSLAECQIKKQIVLIFRLSLWLILAAKSIAYIMEALCGAIKEGLDERKLEKEKETPAADVAKLRQMTGAGMMDCKKALVEANGDYERAKDVVKAANAEAKILTFKRVSLAD